jgi:hypothetical protein
VQYLRKKARVGHDVTPTGGGDAIREARADVARNAGAAGKRLTVARYDEFAPVSTKECI